MNKAQKQKADPVEVSPGPEELNAEPIEVSPEVTKNPMVEELENHKTETLWDSDLTKKLQKATNLKQTGKILNQDVDNKSFLPLAGDGWEFGLVVRYGSTVIRRIQLLLGVESNGQFDKNTLVALQAKLGVPNSGKLDSDTVMALDAYANEKLVSDFSELNLAERDK